MDGMTLILPTKLKSIISARAKSLIETAETDKYSVLLQNGKTVE